MKQNILISGASIAGLTLAYWLDKYGCRVTVVEISNGLRRGGSPVDVRGDALAVADEMGILERIKAKEFIHTDEIVNAENETLISFSINSQAEYAGDIEIHRDDLIDILNENVSAGDIEFLFENRIETLTQKEDHVDVVFKNGESRRFDLVFGADGTHSAVRKLVFGPEDNYARFFGAYFAGVDASAIKPGKANTGVTMYKEPGKGAVLYPFKNALTAVLFFRSPKLKYDYKDMNQHKQILQEKFHDCAWRIPEILDIMLRSNDLYFDEVCQIHMSSWSKGRVALVGDAAYTASFPTGMGTSLAMLGATILAKNLNTANGDYAAAFSAYYTSYQPYVENVQARITRGLDWLISETQKGIDEAIERFKK